MSLRNYLIVKHIGISERRRIFQGFGLHDHICEDQIGSIGVELGQLARLADAGIPVSCVSAIADIKHQLRCEHLMEVVELTVSVIVIMEVVFVIG